MPVLAGVFEGVCIISPLVAGFLGVIEAQSFAGVLDAVFSVPP